jgi:hypothetical protein
MAVVRLRSALALARQIDPFCTLQTANAESFQTDQIGGSRASAPLAPMTHGNSTDDVSAPE